MIAVTPGLISSMIALGCITYFYRYSFLSHQGREWGKRLPPELLKLLGPATFAAIIANHLVGRGTDPEELRRKTGVAVASLLVAWLTKSVLATLIFGLGLLYLLQNFTSLFGQHF